MKYFGTKNGIDYGFFEHSVYGAKEISDDEWKFLLDEQSKGKVIRLDNCGNLVAVDTTVTDGQLASDVRRKRDELLKNTDWTQLFDCRMSYDTRCRYAMYRQKLRDVPQQPGFPHDIEWPVMD